MEYAPVIIMSEKNDFQKTPSYNMYIYKQGQNISYYGINAHFQNNTAEKPIREIQEQTINNLHNYNARFPYAIKN